MMMMMMMNTILIWLVTHFNMLITSCFISYDLLILLIFYCSIEVPEEVSMVDYTYRSSRMKKKGLYWSY